jgi:hypothetical protein
MRRAAVCALGLTACAGTPLQPPLAVPVEVRSGWRGEFGGPQERRPCDWQGEVLLVGGEPLWGELPEPSVPCGLPAPGAPRGVQVDVVGRDGPYVSTVLRVEGTPPERAPDPRVEVLARDVDGVPPWARTPDLALAPSGGVACRTWDVRTGLPVSLAAYDAGRAARRWARALRTTGEDAPARGLDPGGFVVGDGHVRFCLRDGDTITWLRVR